MTTVASNYLYSTLRERIVEHVFIGDALRELWRLGVYDVEVLRSEFDAHGYDLVMARGKIVRHIQFKTGTQKKPGTVSLSRALAEKPSGCAIWIRLESDLAMGPFFWFGAAPGEPLAALDHYPNSLRVTPNKTGVRPIRKNHHEVPGAAFIPRSSLQEILADLFGNLKPTAVVGGPE
ncbi:hypothetical protein LB545_30475 [Mesorhizobium sp. BR1-1-6]|uniref:hypothetical protein n=1 Tax=Mesorhizobium sp. BR1-1-6 TaxID=2876648 RepID=UPI001CD17A29|nr:hypothetical protein [Mesorhizobium sp. BR1-1-6]MBZ9898638.1 hypothetical protein [Mesorhizobium sp. BR1-1-6]